MQKVYCFYKLRDGVSAEDYVEWSKTVDQVLTREQPAVRSFRVYAMSGSRAGTPEYDVVEDIEVESWPAWLDCLAQPAMTPVVEGFRAMADRESAITIYGAEIV